MTDSEKPALVENMLSGGGPVVTTDTGGIGEAVGTTALVVPAADPGAIAAALDKVLAMDDDERAAWSARAREHALQFERGVVLDKILDRVAAATRTPALLP